NCIVRSDCVVMRTNAPRPRSRTRAGKTQKFSLPFLFSSAVASGLQFPVWWSILKIVRTHFAAADGERLAKNSEPKS
ncbi:MAG: hypothetical protein AAB428_03535, partial [Patescibacteria group bacterium]